jgi:Zn-finger nucleic acid-binding protein
MTMSCPFCNATVAPPPDVVEVERVVQRVVVVEGEGSAMMRCPRCGGSCREGHARDGTVLRGCSQCAGLWIDNATVARLRDYSDGDIEGVARDLTRIVAMPMPREQRLAELSCPTCAKPMRRIAIPETIHSVDVCSDHGTWFDRDELSMFVRTFAEARAGTVTDDDLAAAGIPGAQTKPGGGGFFTDLFASLGIFLGR